MPIGSRTPRSVHSLSGVEWRFLRVSDVDTRPTAKSMGSAARKSAKMNAIARLVKETQALDIESEFRDFMARTSNSRESELQSTARDVLSDSSSDDDNSDGEP